jgi:NAD(P)-dependent dehydrogenase (short-subunit alcohol dehydrogenase family)
MKSPQVVPMDLSNKVAVVTGAGGGIGKPTALTLAASGASVIAADIDFDAASITAGLIRDNGGKAIAVRVDITREADVQALMAAAQNEFGGIDVLVNNAALGSREDHDIHGMDGALWDHVVAGNTRGTMSCCKHALPAMIEKGSGVIVNIASGAALTGQLTLPAYAAAKAAVISLTQSVATMYGKQGIRCNAIAPGLILHERLAPGYPPAHIQMDLDNVLTPYQGTAQDIANAVLFLASDSSRFITGHVLPVDGGLLAHTPFYAGIRALDSVQGSRS